MVSLVLPAAREFAQYGIRVNAIAPGIFLTPMLLGLSNRHRTASPPRCRSRKSSAIRAQYAALVHHMVENRYLNGEVVRLDAALRMAPR